MLKMNKYGIWNEIEDVQEVKNYDTEQIIEFANIERVAVTGVQEEITTLEEAENFLLTLGYIVEEM
ncbi:hypothetical protein [Staphylococcus phage Stab20]|nr:hypothetical protein [Staphylococcus phage Stab20]